MIILFLSSYQNNMLFIMEGIDLMIHIFKGFKSTLPRPAGYANFFPLINMSFIEKSRRYILATSSSEVLFFQGDRHTNLTYRLNNILHLTISYSKPSSKDLEWQGLYISAPYNATTGVILSFKFQESISYIRRKSRPNDRTPCTHGSNEKSSSWFGIF